ncbi:hypothetical protein CEQ90_11800 [Lewinellaceae bacterium SD302]|nr:hypothetical protein CEQ90_11800 [Lewinellaceae bacterium SD302]
MGKILVPVDFSINCYNAFRYGMRLAEATGREVLVAHYFRSSLGNENTGSQSDYQSVAVEKIRQFVLPVNHLRDFDYEDFSVATKIFFESRPASNVAAAIRSRAEQEDIDIVVMGTKSSAAVHEKWLGSVSIRVSAVCDRPVFLIPPKVDFTPMKRIVVANTSLVAEPYALWQIKGLAELYSSKVYFVHVSRPETDGDLRFIPWQLMRELHDGEPAVGYNYTVAEVNDEDISQGLLTYVAEIHADVLVMVNDTKSADQKIIHETLTQDLALRANLPIVVLHTESGREERINNISTYGRFREV